MALSKCSLTISSVISHLNLLKSHCFFKDPHWKYTFPSYIRSIFFFFLLSSSSRWPHSSSVFLWLVLELFRWSEIMLEVPTTGEMPLETETWASSTEPKCITIEWNFLSLSYGSFILLMLHSWMFCWFNEWSLLTMPRYWCPGRVTSKSLVSVHC